MKYVPWWLDSINNMPKGHEAVGRLRCQSDPNNTIPDFNLKAGPSSPVVVSCLPLFLKDHHFLLRSWQLGILGLANVIIIVISYFHCYFS